MQSDHKSLSYLCVDTPPGTDRSCLRPRDDDSKRLNNDCWDIANKDHASTATGADMDTSISALADLNAKVAGCQIPKRKRPSRKPHRSNPTTATQPSWHRTRRPLKMRAKLQSAQKDLIAARADATTIIKAIKASEKQTVTASTTVNQ